MKYNQPYGEADPNASFTNGNPGAGIKGSIPPAAAIEHPQREIVNVIAAAGLVPSEANLGQLLAAITQLIADGAVDLDTDGTMAANSDTVAASQKATRTYIATKLAALIAAAPTTLDTLNELAFALGNDPNFAATTAAQIGLKLDASAVSAFILTLLDDANHTAARNTLQAAGRVQKDFITMTVKLADTTSIWVDLDAEFDFTVTEIGAYCQTGSCTVSLYAGGGATLIGSQAASTSGYASNTSVSNNVNPSNLAVKLTSIVNCKDLFIKIYLERAMA